MQLLVKCLMLLTRLTAKCCLVFFPFPLILQALKSLSKTPDTIFSRKKVHTIDYPLLTIELFLKFAYKYHFRWCHPSIQIIHGIRSLVLCLVPAFIACGTKGLSSSSASAAVH